MEELLQLWVLDTCCAEAEDHLGRQRVGITSDVIDEHMRLIQKFHEHGFVLQVLLRDMGSRRLDVQVVVNNIADHPPFFAVLLYESASYSARITSLMYVIPPEPYAGLHLRSVQDTCPALFAHQRSSSSTFQILLDE